MLGWVSLAEWVIHGTKGRAGLKAAPRALRHFGSIHRISEARVDELAPFVGRKTATEIADHFVRQRALAEGANAAA